MINFIIVKEAGKIKSYKKIGAAHLRNILSDNDNKIWLDIKKPDIRDIGFLKKIFKFHDLALEDCIEPDQRTKIDEYGSHLFINIHPILYSKGIKRRDLKLFLGENYIVTVHLKNIKQINIVNKKVLESKENLMRPDHILYMISDSIVDEYFPALDKIEDDIETIEEDLFRDVDESSLNKIFDVKIKLIEIRKAIFPQEKIYQHLIIKENNNINSETRLYLRDVHDHVQKIINNINTYQEIIKSDLDMYMSLISYKTNKIIKVLTIISTIIMPLTFITGIYGMNFRYMPELEWQYGYFASLGFMLLVSLGILYILNKKRWL